MKTICPWCGSSKAEIKMEVKDEFLSQEEFHLCECTNCGMLYTMPRPSKDKIGEYYKSDKYYSHQENKSGFIPKLYELVKSFNVKNKFNMATKGKTIGKLLDIGCGVGDFIHTAEQKGWDCVGVEPSDEAKNIAKSRTKGNIIDSEKLEQIQDQNFDVITMWHVLEHVDDIKWQVNQLQRLIKDDGRIVIAVPNYKSYDSEFYQQHWAAYDVPRHLNHFDKMIIAKMFKSKELKLINTEKLVWDAYYISYISEQYMQHSLALMRGVWRGLISNCKARQTGEWSSMVYIFEKIH